MNDRLKQWLRRAIGFRLGQFRMYPPRALALPPRYSEPPRSSGRLPISIVTPVFNQVEYISQTVDSILGQKYQALQYIVMDGGSTDGTAEKLDAVRGRLHYFFSGPDNGQAAAINNGMKHATGDILAWINGDDIVLPGALDYVAAFFEAHPEIDAIYGHRIVIDERGHDIGRWVLPPHSDDVLDWADFIPQETLYWRRSAWQRIGAALDESYAFAMDWDLLIRLREAGVRFSRVPRYLGGFRAHAAQKTSTTLETTGRREMARIYQRTVGRVPTPAERARHLAPYIIRHAILQRADRLFGLY